MTDVEKGLEKNFPLSFKKSVAWFLCSCAELRLRKFKKPLSMLMGRNGIWLKMELCSSATGY